jgi:hypothetical protein
MFSGKLVSILLDMFNERNLVRGANIFSGKLGSEPVFMYNVPNPDPDTGTNVSSGKFVVPGAIAASILLHTASIYLYTSKLYNQSE